MAGPSLVVRVAANMSELRQNLAEDVPNQIEVTRSALARLTTAYDGTKIISQANATMAAIQQIGGVTKLTEDEQARANAVLQTALDKYDALGKEAPAGMQAIADATKQVNEEHKSLFSSLKEVAAAFGIAYSIEGSIRFLETVVEEAKALKNLSLQTNINIEDLQVLTAATRDFGVDGEQLGRALFQLQQRIAGGDQSVSTAFHLMGMSLDEVKDKNPMELFLATERGLGTLSGAIQDTAAKDLYGGRLGASLIAFSKGSDEAIAKAKALNTIASTESVKAAAEYADAIDRMTHSLHAFAMEQIGGVAQGFNVLTDAVDKGASKWSIFVAMLKDWATTSTATGANTTHLAALLDSLNHSTGKDIELTAKSAEGHREIKAALDAHGQAAQFMAALELDSAKPLLEWQTQYLDHMKAIGQLTAQNAAAIGVNADQFTKYQASIEEAKKALEDWDKELAARAVAEKAAFATESGQLAELSKVTDAYYKAVAASSHDVLGAKIADAYAAADAEIAAMLKAKTYTTAAAREVMLLADQIKANLIQNQLEEDVHSHAHFVKLADEAQIAYDRAQAHADQYSADWIQKLRDTATAAKLAADTWGLSFDTALTKIDEKSKTVAADVTLTWSQAMGLVSKGLGTMSGTVQNADTSDSSRSAIQHAWDTGHYFGPVLGGSQTNPHGTGPDFSKLGFRADGGPVSGGKPYVVGERGPELFVPSGPGQIVPNGASAGTGSIAIHIDAREAMFDTPAGVQRLADKVMSALNLRLRGFSGGFA